MMAMLVAATPAMADAEGTTSGDVTDKSKEIIVTAQKRAQNLQDVPISMEVVSGQRLADFNSNDIVGDELHAERVRAIHGRQTT
jgi:iron complex outermembrane receptor protein